MAEHAKSTVQQAKKKKRRARAGERGEEARPGVEDSWLRQQSDSRSERRFEAKTPLFAVITIVGMSIGAVLLGAGVYGQFLRAEALGPSKYALYLLAASAVVLLGIALFGQRVPKPVRVGDAGVAIEKDA